MYFDKTKIYDGQRNKIKERKIERLVSIERKRVKQRETDRQKDRQKER
jgi:hypothetical protein